MSKTVVRLAIVCAALGFPIWLIFLGILGWVQEVYYNLRYVSPFVKEFFVARYRWYWQCFVAGELPKGGNDGG